MSNDKKDRGICPKCWDTAQTAYQNARASLSAQYGVMAEDQFVNTRNTLDRSNPMRGFSCNLKREYNVDIDENNILKTTFEGTCSDCGAAYSYTHQVDIKTEMIAAQALKSEASAIGKKAK